MAVSPGIQNLFSDDESRSPGGPLVRGVRVVRVRPARRDAQVAPLLPADLVGRGDDLPDVVARVRERAMERCVDREGLVPDPDRLREVGVRERGERLEQDVPALAPLGEQLLARDGADGELLLALALGLLAVAREEVGEARPEVPGDVPADHGERVPAGGPGVGEGRLRHLLERGLGERLVAAVLVGDGLEYGAHLPLDARR
jgi:hypothetical protein